MASTVPAFTSKRTTTPQVAAVWEIISLTSWGVAAKEGVDELRQRLPMIGPLPNSHDSKVKDTSTSSSSQTTYTPGKYSAASAAEYATPADPR